MNMLRILHVTLKGCTLVFIHTITLTKCDSEYSPRYRSDRQPPESLIWIKDGSRSIIECLTHCEADKFCVAVSMNASSCLGYSGFLVDKADPLVTKQNFVYTRKDACRSGGFMSYSRHRLCIQFYTQRETRTAANEKCRLAGGRLIRVDTRVKHEFLKNFLKNDVTTKGNIHIDGKAVVRGIWKYADGSNMEYTKWAPRKPDNGVMPACCILWGNSNFDMDDWLCGSPFHFICEKTIFH